MIKKELTPVDLSNVTIEGPFWAQRMKINRERTIPQNEVVGHAVSAMNLYSSMADLAVEFGDEQLRAACDRLWNNMTSKRMYITGSIGPLRNNYRYKWWILYGLN